MPYIVLKPVPLGNGKKIAPGTVVEADNWRNRRSLELGRYIQRIEVGNKGNAIEVTAEPSIEPVEETAVEPTEAETPAKKKVGRPAKTDKKD